MPRIAIIGAGSVVFAQKLISDILQRPGIRNPEFVLMDIDADRLKLAEIMSKKTAEAMNVKVPIETTTNRKAAIKNANYVINSVQVGGYPSTKIDFEIPARYGLKQTIADTIGIGGIFRGLRTYPVMKGITEDIMEVGAKGCFLLNYSNPMAMNMLSVWNTGDIPGVGLCHSVQGTSKMLAGRAGVDFADVSYKCGGINHMAFFTELKYKGKDLYPILFQKLLADPGAMGEKVRFEMMKRTGYFVTESSEHQSEYVPYFIHHGDACIKEFDIPINEYIRRCESIIARWSAQQKEFANPNKKVEVGAISHEYGSEIINAMETGIPAVVYGNVPNKNLIDNVSNDAVVEVACLVDRNGLQPTHFGKLPTVLAGIVATNVNMQLATIEAAVKGSRELVYHAAMLDPHTGATLTLDKIWAMCDELFEAHKQHLPQFAPVLKGTGRSLKSLGETQAHVNVTAVGVPFVDGKKEIEVEVEAVNLWTETKSVSLNFASNLKGVSFSKSPLAIKVEAGKSAKEKIRVTFPDTNVAAFTLYVTSDDTSVLCRDLHWVKRDTLELKKEGAGAEIKISFSQDTVLAGSISLQNGHALLDLQVNDTDIKLNEAKPWEASSIELVVSENGQRTTKFFFLPEVGKKTQAKLEGSGPVASTELETEKNIGGYRMRVKMPKQLFGLDKRNHFLFNMKANVTALGTEHGRTEKTLYGHNIVGDFGVMHVKE